MQGSLERLLEVLKLKLKLLDEIYKITLLQKEKIEENDIDGLLNLIKSKGARINKIKNIDINYKALRKNEEMLEVDKSVLNEINGLEEEIQQIIRKINSADELNKRNLETNYNQIKEKLQKIKIGQKVRSHYYKIPDQVHGYYIDSKK